MVVTSLTLAGRPLDGGHIIYAVFPRGHRWITLLTVGVLIRWPAIGGMWLWRPFCSPPVGNIARPPRPGLDGKRKLLALLMIFVLQLASRPFPIHDSAQGMYSPA